MKLPRRHFLQLAASATAFPAVVPFARAQSYTARPVHIIVGFPPGGSADIVARLIGEHLSGRLGQQFIVEARPGAGTNIGTEAVARATPDGYTLLLVTQTNAVNATLYDKLNFNFIRDIEPVGGILRVPGVMVVNPAFPAKTVAEFITYAKGNPGKINMGSGGNGSAQQLYGELFKMMTGVDMVHVPYRGQPLTDLLGGEVQVVFSPIPSAIEFIRGGKLRALGVTAAARVEALPDVPSISEFVPAYEATGWFGLGAPKNTPGGIIGALNTALDGALAEPKLKTQLADLGGTVLDGSPDDFRKLIAAETEKWGKVIKFASIRVD